MRAPSIAVSDIFLKVDSILSQTSFECHNVKIEPFPEASLVIKNMSESQISLLETCLYRRVVIVWPGCCSSNITIYTFPRKKYFTIIRAKKIVLHIARFHSELFGRRLLQQEVQTDWSYGRSGVEWNGNTYQWSLAN